MTTTPTPEQDLRRLRAVAAADAIGNESVTESVERAGGDRVTQSGDGVDLVPGRFTRENAQEMAQRAVVARRERAEARRSDEASGRRVGAARDEAATAVDELLEVAAGLVGARAALGQTAFAGALVLTDRVRRGKVEDRHLHYAAQAIEKLTNVGRLEAGEPTSATLSVTANPADFRAWVQGIKNDLAAPAAN